jgi:hypothetical protein
VNLVDKRRSRKVFDSATPLTRYQVGHDAIGWFVTGDGVRVYGPVTEDIARGFIAGAHYHEHALRVAAHEATL